MFQRKARYKWIDTPWLQYLPVLFIVATLGLAFLPGIIGIELNLEVVFGWVTAVYLSILASVFVFKAVLRLVYVLRYATASAFAIWAETTRSLLLDLWPDPRAGSHAWLMQVARCHYALMCHIVRAPWDFSAMVLNRFPNRLLAFADDTDQQAKSMGRELKYHVWRQLVSSSDVPLHTKTTLELEVRCENRTSVNIPDGYYSPGYTTRSVDYVVEGYRLNGRYQAFNRPLAWTVVRNRHPRY